MNADDWSDGQQIDGAGLIGLRLFHPDPTKKLSVNSASVIEQSHEYVLTKKNDSNAPNQ